MTFSAPLISVYESKEAAPQVGAFNADGPLKVIHSLPKHLYTLLEQKASQDAAPFPLQALIEVVENLVHADFTEVVVTIAHDGSRVRISDGGPGIPFKQKALEEGFTTAGSSHKKFIRGVGAGLPLAVSLLKPLGASLTLEDNLTRGSVVTLSYPSERHGEALLDRQKTILSLLLEGQAAGPSRLAEELLIPLSTCYRDLVYLERLKLVKRERKGMRSLTQRGLDRLQRQV